MHSLGRMTPFAMSTRRIKDREHIMERFMMSESKPRVNKMSEGEVRTWVLYIRFSAMSEDRKRRIASRRTPC
jgi:hypothetical protein